MAKRHEAGLDAPAGETAEHRHILHGVGMGGSVYAHALMPYLDKLFGDDPSGCAHRYVDDLLKRMEPRDPMEEMLVVQALLAHVRVLNLSHLASTETHVDRSRVLNEYADKASNTFRRLMLAMAEYRRPPKASISQANIAHNQVVMSGGTERENRTNEQGYSAEKPTALPPERGRSHGTSRRERTDETVGAVHGTPDA
ncbi:MAG: hypothetical protein AAGI53_02090 [Planctomycetota bacterium]